MAHGTNMAKTQIYITCTSIHRMLAMLGCICDIFPHLVACKKHGFPNLHPIYNNLCNLKRKLDSASGPAPIFHRLVPNQKLLALLQIVFGDSNHPPS